MQFRIEFVKICLLNEELKNNEGANYCLFIIFLLGDKDMSNELTNIEYEDVKNLIYTIRGRQVMLDSDVARFYERETKVINQTRKRNLKKFPEDFCFQLTAEEYKALISQIGSSRSQIVTLNRNETEEAENLKSQIVTSSLIENEHGGRRKLPYVYTEHGVSMLSPLLNSEIAIEVSIKIIRAFV